MRGCADERHGVPRPGPTGFPGRAQGAPYGLRRHRGRNQRHQPRPARPLPHEAVGSAGREALPRSRRPPERLVRVLPPPVRGNPRGRFIAVPQEPRREGLPVAQPRLGEIETAATRIYELVPAVKGFIQVDRETAARPTDVGQGLTDTLTMLRFKVKAKSAAVTVSVAP